MMIKRLICLVFAVCLLIITVDATEDGAVFAFEEADGGDVVVMTVPDTQGMAVAAKAAFVMEAETGRILFAQDANEQLPLASTTKIMTALITLEQPGLDTEFIVDPQAIRVEGSSMGLEEGDRVTLRTLAAGMLLPSGNDAANAAAVRISGSIPQFVEKMNRRAKEIGMKNTSFETPSGLDGEQHYSSAYDLALLAREALSNQDFTDICSQYRMRVSYGNPPYNRWLTNHNKMLNYYEGTSGMKTGFTKKAGRCLVTTAERDGVQLICVTLNCGDDWTTHKNLYDRFFSTMQVEDIAQDIPPICIPVTGGVQTLVASVKQGEIPVAVPTEGGFKVEYDVTTSPFLYAPVTAGQVVGQVEVLLDGSSMGILELTAANGVALLHPYEEEKETVWQRVQHFFEGLYAHITEKNI